MRRRRSVQKRTGPKSWAVKENIQFKEILGTRCDYYSKANVMNGESWN